MIRVRLVSLGKDLRFGCACVCVTFSLTGLGSTASTSASTPVGSDDGYSYDRYVECLRHVGFSVMDELESFS